MATGAAKLVVVEEAEKAGWVYFGTDLDSPPPPPTPNPGRAGWLTAHWCSAAWRRWRAGALEAGSTSGACYNAWSVYLAGAQVAPMSFLRLRRGGRKKKLLLWGMKRAKEFKNLHAMTIKKNNLIPAPTVLFVSAKIGVRMRFSLTAFGFWVFSLLVFSAVDSASARLESIPAFVRAYRIPAGNRATSQQVPAIKRQITPPSCSFWRWWSP